MQFLKDMTKKRDEFRTLISREEKMVMADPTRDKVRGFENYIAEKVSEFNKLAADAKVTIRRQKILEAPTVQSL